MLNTEGIVSFKYAVGEFVLVYIIQSLNFKNILSLWKHFNKTIYLDIAYELQELKILFSCKPFNRT